MFIVHEELAIWSQCCYLRGYIDEGDKDTVKVIQLYMVCLHTFS